MKILKEKPKYFYACVAYTAMFILCLIGQLLVNYTPIKAIAPEEVKDLVWAVISQILAMSGIPLLLILLLEKPNKKQFIKEIGVRHTVKWWVYPASVGLTFLVMGVTIGISFLTELVILMLGGRVQGAAPSAPTGAGLFLLSVLTTAILPGICEEFLHRGILVRGLKGHFKDGALIALVALLFALMHSYISQLVYTFVMGIVLSALAVKLRTIWPSVIIHFCNNFFATYQDYAQLNGWWLGDVFANADALLRSNLLLAAFLWFVCVCGTILSTWAIIKYGMKRERREQFEKEEEYDYPTFLNQDGIPVARFHPITGQPLFKKRRPVSALIAEEKTWLIGIILMGIVYTALTLVWRMI